MEDTIKKILEHGGRIYIPYKKQLNDWFSNIGINLELDTSGKYVIYGEGSYFHNHIRFDTLDEALDELTKSADNVGAIQEYVRHKNPHLEVDGDLDWDEVKRLVRNEKARRKRQTV